jgi:beta-phosphoglucomutase-like phosphatase (HAD superfamily)
MIDGGMVTKGKPNPETFLKAAAQLKVLPSNTIVFEDAAKGITAALEGEMIAVGVGKEDVLGHAHYVIPGFENMEYDVLLEILNERMLPIQN